MVRLNVNIDHVATLRQARQAQEPDPVAAALLCELAGADGITVHIRADRRHIQERDLEMLRRTLKTRLNVEMATEQDTIRLVMSIAPDQVTFVPERPDELTTEGGLDVMTHRDTLKNNIALFKEREVHVSLFVDPNLDQVKAAHMVGAQAVEINTGRYCESPPGPERERQLQEIVNSIKLAGKLGMGCHAGHGLDYRNLLPVAALAEIEEFNIGHAIIARAALVGMERAVREMIDAIRRARR
ncbi:MAG: pyridoxine 5'-phosphate synthase [Candidatus Alcyoniella australis]|nr:pyridoxine 5'-phosphate synthase [Candidatus Alcyoniella australis]